MEFRKLRRDATQFWSRGWLEWRLASLDEVNNNLEKIKEEKIFDSWDIARLLDGWVDGPGYRYSIKNEYKSNMGDMLLVKTPESSRSSESSFAAKMYDGVQLSKEGREAALLLSCEDKTTEIICFVLQSIVDEFKVPDRCQLELDRLNDSMERKFRNKRTVLHYAADQPHNPEHAKYVAELLLKKFEYGKELIKATDKFGMSALHYAALNGHIDSCNYLMNECELKGDDKNRNDENLLHFAVNSNDVALVKSLCRLDKVKRLIDSPELKGKTPLHKAAAKGHIEMMESLLEQAGNKEGYVRQDDLFGQTALHEAVSGGHMEAVKFLLNNGSRPIAERNSDGKTALHYAVQLPKEKEPVKVAELLLNACGSDEERSLLLWASACGTGTAEKSTQPSSPVQIYLQKQRKRLEKTPDNLLRTAIELKREDIAWELINRGAKTHWLANCSDSDIKNFRERIKRIPDRGRDQPTIDDSLGRRTFAEGLAALFLNPYVKTPVTVGITGDWGMGKSSLMMQTEMILLKTGAQLAFPNLLPREEFPGSEKFVLSRKGRKKYQKIKEAVRDSLVSEEFIDADWKIKEAVTDLLASETDADLVSHPEARIKFQNFKKEIMLAVSYIPDAGPKDPRNYQKFVEKVTNVFESEEFTIQGAHVELPTTYRSKYLKIKEAVTDISANAHPLLYLLNNYQDNHYDVYRSLAAMDRSEMFCVEGETQYPSSNGYSLGKIPNILTVRYNAWHYRTESEAWAGLAVNVTKAIEETMTRAQRIRCRCKYAWSQHKDEILLQLFLPCLLAIFFSGWLAWAVWMLLSRSKHKELVDLKYGSIPVTVVVVVWTVVKQLLSVLKPISVQIMGYASLPDHTRNLGYQHQVISDINFLKDQMGEKPSWFWRFMAFERLWRLCRLYPDTVKDTSIPKSPPSSKDDVRIIVFVDDLDRCQDTVILEVLSAVNLVLAACGINVVLGMDKKMIARAIANKFHDSPNQDTVVSATNLMLSACGTNGVLGIDKKMIARAMQNKFEDGHNNVDPVDLAEKYISKIVQLPLALPDPDDDETKSFLDQQLGKEFGRGSKIPERAQSSGDAQCSADRSLDRAPPDIQQNDRRWCTDFPPNCFDLFEQAHTVLCVGDRGSSEVDSNSNGREQARADFWSKHPVLLKPLRMLRNILPGCVPGCEEERLKLQSTLLNSQRMMPTYSFKEREVIYELRKLTTDTQKLPREWKQFLTYHRLAWNILYQLKEVQNLPGWQVQLLVWIFCCWQWKDKINNIIKKWNEISLSDEERSLLHIVEHYIEEMLSPHPINNDSNIQGGETEKADEQRKKNDDEDEGEKEDTNIQEQEEEKKKQDKQKKKENGDRKEKQVEEEKKKQDNKKKNKEEGMKKIDLEDDKKKMQWEILIRLLLKYDVSMNSIQFFQKFRLHCEVGHLPCNEK